MQGVRIGRLLFRTLQSRHSCVSIGQREWQMNRRSGAANEEGPPPTKCPKVDAASVEVNSKSINKEDRLIWVDLEMTGLDVDSDHILEMACIVTDGDMNIIAEGPDVIVHQPDSVLDAMNSWCKEHHGKSGLTEACRKSTMSLAEMEDQMLSFVQQHTPQHKCPLAGNTIHMDKRFLDKYLKRFSSHLHYRIVDVSSIKELCRRWYPQVHAKAPPKMNNHRALDDIRESIEELKYYKQNIFKPH